MPRNYRVAQSREQFKAQQREYYHKNREKRIAACRLRYFREKLIREGMSFSDANKRMLDKGYYEQNRAGKILASLKRYYNDRVTVREWRSPDHETAVNQYMQQFAL